MNLIFIYNANSGYINALFDSANKLVSPKTYQCSLCSLTHGTFKEKKEWSEFTNQSMHNFEFLHKDEFEKQFEQKFNYPCVLVKRKNKLELIFDNRKLNTLYTISELINEVENITT